MPSIKATVLAAALVAVAHADYKIDPETVSPGTRERWCEDQTNTCPTICASVDDRKVMVNDCDPDSLSYGCICGNGKQPNMTEYTLTLPYHTCTEYGNQCVDACEAHDNECASACRSDNPCGAQDPWKPSGTVKAAAPTATDEDEDEDEVFGGMKGDEEGSARRMKIGGAYGTLAVLGGLLAGFAML